LAIGLSILFYTVLKRTGPYHNTPDQLHIGQLLMIAFRLLVKEVYARGLKGWSQKQRVLIYGAGNIGMATKKAIDLDDNSGKKIYAFVDDDPNKIGKSISGISIISGNLKALQISLDKTISKSSSLLQTCQSNKKAD
jgi:FlaA1/EpsC-like NDP-sugar epimerase